MNYEERTKLMKDKMSAIDFKYGDRFAEMYSYWVYIVDVKDNMVYTLEGHPTNMPMELKAYTKEGLVTRFKYSTMDDYWIDFIDNDPVKTSHVFDLFLKHHKKEDARDLQIDVICGMIS